MESTSRNWRAAKANQIGGGYDVYARLLARHLPRHIPGTPTIIVQNMPGAGSLAALRHQEAIAPKNGSVVTLFDFFQIINSMLIRKKPMSTSGI